MCAGCLLLAALVFGGLLVALHRLKPEIDPRWRMINEYEISRYGTLMRVAFACWTASYLALAALLWPHLPLPAAVLFVIVVLGPLGAGLYVTDPITAPPEAITPAGRWHTWFRRPRLRHHGSRRRGHHLAAAGGDTGLHPWLVAMAIVAWLGFLVFVITLVAAQRSGRPLGPDALIGGPNRLMVAGYWLWAVVIAVVSLR